MLSDNIKRAAGEAAARTFMKNDNFSEENDPVSSALGEWKVTASLPPRFNEEVWRRIESAEQRTTVWDAISSWLGGIFAKPAMAVAYMSVLTLLGLALGFTQAEKKTTELQAQLSSRYVQSIDPYQRTHR